MSTTDPVHEFVFDKNTANELHVFDNFETFKIPQLLIILTDQDKADMVAYMRLLR